MNASQSAGELRGHPCGLARPDASMPQRRSTLGDVEPTTAAILGGLAGLLIGFLVWAAITMSDREREPAPEPEPEVPRGVGDVLAVLRSSGVVLDLEGRVITTSPAAITYGLVRNQRLMHPEIIEMVERVAREHLEAMVNSVPPSQSVRPSAEVLFTGHHAMSSEQH